MPDPDLDPRLLLVEGQDDKHVIRQIVDVCGLGIDITIREAEGIDRLLATIPSRVNVPDRKVLGIVVDANGDPEARWKKVTEKLQESQTLQKAAIQLPTSPATQGTILASIGRTPRIGLWMMPDNAAPGELEDFVRKMIPEGDPVWPKADAYIDDIPEPRQFQSYKVDKAKVHAWMATRRKPGRMGAAIGAGDLDVGVESCQTFVQWLRELFS